MNQFKISDAKTPQTRRYRAAVAYPCLVIASLLIFLAGHEVIYLFGFTLETSIRDVNGWKALSVFITMLPIVGGIIWLTLMIIKRICFKLNI